MTSLASLRAAVRAVDERHDAELDAQDEMVIGGAAEAWRKAVWNLTPETYKDARPILAGVVESRTTEATAWFADAARKHVGQELEPIAPAARRTANLAGSYRTPIYDVRQLADGLLGRLDEAVRGQSDIPGVLLAESHQVERIVQTEGWRSYNRTRALMMDALWSGGDRSEYFVSVEASQARDAGDWIPGILKWWRAVLDRRACPRCTSLDGTIRLLGMAFDGEADPPLHPKCRCRAGFFPIAVPKAK